MHELCRVVPLLLNFGNLRLVQFAGPIAPHLVYAQATACVAAARELPEDLFTCFTACGFVRLWLLSKCAVVQVVRNAGGGCPSVLAALHSTMR